MRRRRSPTQKTAGPREREVEPAVSSGPVEIVRLPPNRPDLAAIPTNPLPVQRLESVTLTGRKPKTFSISKASKLVAKNVDSLDQATVEEALEAMEGKGEFASIDALVSAVCRHLGVTEDGGEETGAAPAAAATGESAAPDDGFAQRIDGVLGQEAPPELADFYVRQINRVRERMDAGEVGVRWATLDPKQKDVVLTRALEAMVSLGIPFPDPVAFYQQATVILHGSYLFGEAVTTPGDIDLIVQDGPKSLGKKVGVGGHLERMPADDFMVGHRPGLLDFVVGIPLSEPRDPVNLGAMDRAEILGPLIDEAAGYKQAADTEKDEGKRTRKMINIAVTLQYLLRRIEERNDILDRVVADANRALVSGRFPSIVGLGATIDAAIEHLREYLARLEGEAGAAVAGKAPAEGDGEEEVTGTKVNEPENLSAEAHDQSADSSS